MAIADLLEDADAAVYTAKIKRDNVTVSNHAVVNRCHRRDAVDVTRRRQLR